MDVRHDEDAWHSLFAGRNRIVAALWRVTDDEQRQVPAFL
jgi:hypothetical protein